MKNKEPRGIRNNNPGNLRYNQTNHWKGAVSRYDKKDSEFEEFESIEYGYRALMLTLRVYHRYHGCDTITDYIQRWAPNSENNTIAYIKVVCSELQVPNTYIPDVDDEDTLCSMAAAISFVENGRRGDNDIIHQAYKML